MSDTDNGTKATPEKKESSRPWRRRLIGYVKRKYHQRRTKKEKESPADRAARRTADATVCMAVVTVVLATVSGLTLLVLKRQLKEMRDGGIDTHNLASAASDQAVWTQRLAASAGTQADRTKDLARQTAIQAKEATVAANAAQSAAKTADQALHVSERAYVVAGLPTIDTGTKYITLPIVNNGHIPSGKVRAIIHEATLDGTDPTAVHPSVIPLTEAHWRHYEMESVPTSLNQTRNFTVFVPALNVDNLNSGREQIIIVGTITYGDGFPDDAEQQWPFCYGNAMLPQSKAMVWAICDSNLYLPQTIQADHYPNNEYSH